MHEQYVNDPNVESSDLTEELPPKITVYKHNDKWHIDAVEDETDAPDSDSEDEGNQRQGATASKQRSVISKKAGDNKLPLSTPPPDMLQSPSSKRVKAVRVMKRSAHAKEKRSPSPEKSPSKKELSQKSPRRSPSNQKREKDRADEAKVILNDAGEPGQPGDRTGVWQVKKTWVVEYLKISKGRKMSAADIRRAELRRKRAEEAAAAEAARRAWLAMPKRMRGLVVGGVWRISGYLVNVMVYEFKQQPGMYLVRVHNIFAGEHYELKISASVLGKLLGIKRKAARWKPEQKSSAIRGWLSCQSPSRLVPPQAGRPELLEVKDTLTGSHKTRLDWVVGGRFGLQGTHIKRNKLRFRARHRDFEQPPCSFALPIVHTDPMGWNSGREGGEIIRLRDLRQPYKRKTAKKHRSSGRRRGSKASFRSDADRTSFRERAGSSKEGSRSRVDSRESRPRTRSRSRQGSRGESRQGSRSESRRNSKKEPRQRSRSDSRRGSRSESREEQNSMDEGGDGIPFELKKDTEKLAAASSYHGKEKVAKVVEGEREGEGEGRGQVTQASSENDAADPSTSCPFVSYASSAKDFHEWRKAKTKTMRLALYDVNLPSTASDAVPDTVRDDDECNPQYRNSAHVNAYCPRKLFQAPTSILGLGYHKNEKRRGRQVLRIGCKPRREVGNGKRLCGGAEKLDGLLVLFEMYRSGKGDDWYDNRGGGDLIRMYFTLMSDVSGTKFDGKLFKDSTFMIEITVDDCYRCCRGTECMDLALMGDLDALEMEKVNQVEIGKELKQRESEALEECKKALERAKKMSAKGRVEAKNRAEEEFRMVKHEVREERERLKSVIAATVEKAETSWRDVASQTMKKCTWYEVSRRGVDPIWINGQVEDTQIGMPCILAERDRPRIDPLDAYYTIRFDCKVYQCAHKINSISKYRDMYRTLLFTVSQERRRIRFIGYDIETCEYFIFSYSKEEQAETVKFQRDLTDEEVKYQFASAFLNAEYSDCGTYPNSKKRMYKISFVGQVEAGDMEIHMTEDEERRAKDNLESMMRESESRAKSRERAATAKLEDDDEVHFGEVEED